VAGDPFFARAALGLTAAGVGFGALAAIPGLVDFLTIQRARVHRIGWVHALGNGAVLVLAAVSWLLRLGDPAAAVLPWGLALSALTVGLLLMTGSTGGELAYRHMVGVTATAATSRRTPARRRRRRTRTPTSATVHRVQPGNRLLPVAARNRRRLTTGPDTRTTQGLVGWLAWMADRSTSPTG
jgi:uncharacterized membrane protein